MFNIFKKKDIIDDGEIEFLRSVISRLPSKYFYLLNQATKEFILSKKINPLGEPGSYTLLLNASMEKKYSNKNLPSFFIIKGFKVWNNAKNDFDNIELDIMEGMLAGFRITGNYKDLDLSKSDITGIEEKHFKNHDKDIVMDILRNVDERTMRKLDINDTFKIELAEGEFYTIKNLKDGNYLAVNKKGEVYALIHDPYVVKKLFTSFAEFSDHSNSNRFRFNVVFILDFLPPKG
jgi:hypothetical protein